MSIRPYDKEDIGVCAELLIKAYNGFPWGNEWTQETAVRYLNEFADHLRFVGYVLCDDETASVIGAAFCHEKTWYTADELFVDELFIEPGRQRQGGGRQLLQQLEAHCQEHKLAGVTLLTNPHMPAKTFYDKNGFSMADHVVFMYKVIKS